MSAFGPKIFESNLAVYAGALDDPEDAEVAWLALSETQWDLGRVTEHVRQQALLLTARAVDKAMMPRLTSICDGQA